MILDEGTLRLSLVLCGLALGVASFVQLRLPAEGRVATRWWGGGGFALALGAALPLWAPAKEPFGMIGAALSDAGFVAAMACFRSGLADGIADGLGSGEGRGTKVVRPALVVALVVVFDLLSGRGGGIVELVAMAALSGSAAAIVSRGRAKALVPAAGYLELVFAAHAGYLLFSAGMPVIDPLGVVLPFHVRPGVDQLELLVFVWLATLGFIAMAGRRQIGKLELERDKFEVMFNASPDAVLITRLDDGLIVEVNEGFVAMTGFPAEYAVGRTTLELGVWWNPEDRVRLARLLREEGQVDNIECRYRRRDGGSFDGLHSARPLLVDGRSHIFNVVRDISAIQNVREELRESRNLLSEIVENSGALIYVKDFAGRYRLVNREWEKVTGIDRARAAGRTDVELFPGPTGERFLEFDTEVLGKGRLLEREEILGEGESARFFISLKFPLKDAKGVPTGLCGLSTEITARKRAEDRVRALLAEKELILREVHHRVKNNMSAIGGILTMQAQSISSPEAVVAIKDAVARVGSLMVLYDRLYRTEQRGEVRLAEYLGELVDMIVRNYPTPMPIAYEKRFDEIVLGVGAISSVGIIVNELLSNVRKYAFAGRSGGRVLVSATLEGERVQVEVSDDGKGLPPGIDAANGGFGLELVSLLAKSLGGEAKVVSRETGGTRAVVRFPRR